MKSKTIRLNNDKCINLDAANKRGEIMCPICHEKVEPVVRRQRNRVTRGNMCSMLLFG